MLSKILFTLFIISLLKNIFKIYKNSTDSFIRTFKKEFEFVGIRSRLLEKNNEIHTYTSFDLILDILHFLCQLKKNTVFTSLLHIFLFFLLFSLFSFIYSYFILIYFTTFFSLLTHVFLTKIFKRECTIYLKTYTNSLEISDIFINLVLSPVFWAKNTLYCFLAFSRKKIDYEVLDKIILNRIIGCPLWLIMRTYIWTLHIYKILNDDIWSRKSVKIWHKVFIEKFNTVFLIDIGHRMAPMYVLTSENKIKVIDGKIILNQENFLYIAKKCLKHTGILLEPIVANLNKIDHQGFRNPRNGFTTFFTSKPKFNLNIKGDGGIEELLEIKTHPIGIFNKTQYFSNSYARLEDLNYREGYLDKFVTNNNLHNINDLVGLYVRMTIHQELDQSNLFIYQGRDNCIFKFKFNLFNKTVSEQIGENIIVRHNDYSVPIILDQVARSENAMTIENKELETIDIEIGDGLKELSNMSNAEIIKNLKIINEGSFFTLVAKIKNSYKDF